MAETFYRILSEDITDKDNKIINKKKEKVLTSSIFDYDFNDDGKLIPCVRVLSLCWYWLPVKCFKEGLVEQFTDATKPNNPT